MSYREFVTGEPPVTATANFSDCNRPGAPANEQKQAWTPLYESWGAGSTLDDGLAFRVPLADIRATGSPSWASREPSIGTATKETRHESYRSQVIDYRFSTDKVDDLAAYDGSVIVERTKGELSARCDKEEANLLALNLANDVATGKKSVEEARRQYAQTIQDLMAGKKDPYVQSLQFAAQRSAADKDKPAMKQAMAD